MNENNDLRQRLEQEAAMIALELYNINEREKQLNNRMRELKGALDALNENDNN